MFNKNTILEVVTLVFLIVVFYFLILAVFA